MNTTHKLARYLNATELERHAPMQQQMPDTIFRVLGRDIGRRPSQGSFRPWSDTDFPVIGRDEALAAHTALVQQPEAREHILCPCGRCVPSRKLLADAQASGETRALALQPLPPSLYWKPRRSFVQRVGDTWAATGDWREEMLLTALLVFIAYVVLPIADFVEWCAAMPARFEAWVNQADDRAFIRRMDAVAKGAFIVLVLLWCLVFGDALLTVALERLAR